ncbi:MAG: dihydroorotase [Deltaproteobacteria bacterium]|nr:dihydroorotase [Deltaproteobacteria bacterium]
MKKLLINGEMINTERLIIEQKDILINDGCIKGVFDRGEFSSKDDIKYIDISGKYISPGLIDMHVHLREPGEEYKETIESGCLAAAAGGFTGIACMPNTEPANDNSAVTEFIISQARKSGIVRVYPIASITVGRNGASLTEFGELKRAGAVGLSDDGSPVKNSEIMRRALEYARYHKLAVISHCEDTDLSSGGHMHEGSISAKIGIRGIPSISEEIMIKRDISLAEYTGCPVHIAHVSTEGSVQAIRHAKEKGVPVTAETTPHFFTLDHSAVEGYNTNAKVNPPLRTPADVKAIKKGLKDGVIDVIATDHAPHHVLVKEVEFDQAAFGIIGLETAIPLCLNLVRDRVLTLPQLINKLTLQPAKILGVQGGIIKEGERADLAIFDMDEGYILRTDDILSKSKNSPFIGSALKGRNIITMVGGKIVWSRDTKYPCC